MLVRENAHDSQQNRTLEKSNVENLIEAFPIKLPPVRQIGNHKDINDLTQTATQPDKQMIITSSSVGHLRQIERGGGETVKRRKEESHTPMMHSSIHLRIISQLS